MQSALCTDFQMQAGDIPTIPTLDQRAHPHSPADDSAAVDVWTHISGHRLVMKKGIGRSKWKAEIRFLWSFQV